MKLVFKGCIYDLVLVNDSSIRIHSINSVSVVNEFLEIFPNYLHSVPQEREINFSTDFLLDTRPILILSYRMAPTLFKEHKE